MENKPVGERGGHRTIVLLQGKAGGGMDLGGGGEKLLH